MVFNPAKPSAATIFSGWIAGNGLGASGSDLAAGLRVRISTNDFVLIQP